MKDIQAALGRATPIWLYLSVVFLTVWIGSMDWDGVTFLNWISAFSGIIGAIITIAGAYWIAVKQLKPVLMQRRSEQTQEFIMRAQACSKTYIDLSVAMPNLNQQCGRLTIPKPSIYKKQYQESEKFFNEVLSEFFQMNNSVGECLITIRSFIIYNDCAEDLQKYKTLLHDRVFAVGIALNNAQKAMISRGGMTKSFEDTQEELSKALDATQRPLKSFYKAIDEEQQRLERLITEKPKH